MPARIYLRLGDRVEHLAHEEWGEGVVVEEMTSILEGGTCLVRVQFEDGQRRTFDNNLDSERCCYVFGVRRSGRSPTRAARIEPVPPPAPARRRLR